MTSAGPPRDVGLAGAEATAGRRPDYTDKGAYYFATARAEMLPFVPEAARRVLEIGWGDGAFAALLMVERPNVHVTAIEPFADAAARARTRVDGVGEVDSVNGINAARSRAAALVARVLPATFGDIPFRQFAVVRRAVVSGA